MYFVFKERKESRPSNHYESRIEQRNTNCTCTGH
jgi:hypothetical protein